jgi:AcrR family transcriptional regulator
MDVLEGTVTRLVPVPRQRRRQPQPPLSPEQWADAGLHIVARSGWASLTIDNVAAWLRVTKGSFYWHFADRQVFLKAVLARWRFMSTAATLARVVDIADPRERLRRILQLVIEESGPVELDTAFWAARSEPLVAAAIEGASRERIDLLTGLYEELGYSEREARRWALSAYSTFVGLLSTGDAARQVLGSVAERHAYAEHVMTLFVPPRARPNKRLAQRAVRSTKAS